MKALLNTFLYLLFLIPGIYEAGGVLQLVDYLNGQTRYFPDAEPYTTTPLINDQAYEDQLQMAYIILVVVVLWLVIGTVLSALVFMKRVRPLWMGVLLVVNTLIVFPLVAVYVLGSFHI